MDRKLEVYPKMGTARLGNSPNEFYLEPVQIGGLPVACDANGNEVDGADPEGSVRQFKDPMGRIKRQAARFRIVDSSGSETKELTLEDPDVKSIEWTVHIANKKPIWYTFSELQGNLEFGPENSYEQQHIPVNNPQVTGDDDRQRLIIDPGPRKISEPGDQLKFSRYNIPKDYPKGSFPPVGSGGEQIDELGELRMDRSGRLVVLPGLGNVTGQGEIASFRGASGYWDDIADGYVQATVHFKSGETIDVVPGWVLVGSPKYSPESVNITTLYDTARDVAVRKMGACPAMYSGVDTSCEFPLHDGYTPLHGFRSDYVVNYWKEIAPLLDRIDGYRWVADIPYLASFGKPNFDTQDASDDNRAKRRQYFSLFRVPVLPEDWKEWMGKVKNGPNQLFSQEGLPLLPLNSGDNSVTNSGPVYKFETLSATQYFCLNQWAEGKFSLDKEAPNHLEGLTEASMGNCVGAPFSPGIETTWIVRNHKIYASPMRLQLAHFEGVNQKTQSHYQTCGLSLLRDEAEGGGCEPGDLTKRMAIPWQADFHECTVQTPNITNPSVNQFADGTGIQAPPTYYVYWWPPQSPMHVVTGSVDPGEQVMDAAVSNIAGQTVIPAGQRVPYQRGINSVEDIIAMWTRLGFIVNHGSPDHAYFVEQERNSGPMLQAAIRNQDA